MDLPVSRAVARVVEDSIGAASGPPAHHGRQPAHVRVREGAGVPVIGLPIANHDNAQHAANENLRLQNLWDGIEVYAGLIARLGPALE